MTLDMLHADAVTDGSTRRAWSPPAAPAASCTRCSPIASGARHRRGITRPNVVKPETGHPAFDKACHLFGIELRRAPDRSRRRRWSIWTRWPRARRRRTRSHGRFGPQLRLRHHRSHRRALRARARARGGPARRRMPRRLHPPVGRGARLRHPGVRLPPARRHQHLGRHPQVRLRHSRAPRCCASATGRCATCQYFFLTDWTGGKYCSPGIEGSRSGGLLAATWAAMVSLGQRGLPGATPQAIFETAVRDAGRGALASRAADHGRPDVLLQLHVGRLRHLPRERRHAARRAGASTASSTPTPSTWP